ncbi:MAG: GatB/YqeY domain-containing protein [Hyphomicrobiaceae bacterium]
MREEIAEATKSAMKAGEKRRLSTLRLISAAIKDRDIAARVDDKGRSTGRERIDEAEILQLLQKMIKQRREAEETYRDAGRAELVEQEAFEISVIEEFMPEQMSDEDIRAAVTETIAAEAAASLKDMGRTMGALKSKYAGRMDFAKASAIAKALLS